MLFRLTKDPERIIHFSDWCFLVLEIYMFVL